MRIRQRWALIIMISTVQVICLLAGVAWFGGWLNSSLVGMLRSQALYDNRLTAQQITMLIDEMDLQTLESGTTDWQRLQQLVEQIRLPNGGFLCIVDRETGQLVCHPKLRQSPAMRRQRPGQAILQNGSQSLAITQASRQAPGVAVAGWAEMPDGTHLIGAQDLPDLGINVMVHQRADVIHREIDRVVHPTRKLSVLIAIAMTLVAVLVNLFILRLYDSKLADLNSALETQVRNRTRSLVKTRNAIVFGLAKLAESRDSDTGEHLERIRNYVILLAEKLKNTHHEVDDSFISNLALASSLHDIGKVGIPDAILLKPGPLTGKQRRLVERHAMIGGQCLEAIQRKLGDDDFLQMARDIAYSHHERWAGDGYPFGLRGHSIPLAARIVSVADVYDALTTRRPYKEAMNHDEARDFILQGSGSQFDPQIVRAFQHQEEAFREISAAVATSHPFAPARDDTLSACPLA